MRVICTVFTNNEMEYYNLEYNYKNMTFTIELPKNEYNFKSGDKVVMDLTLA
jgi:hypothetical protein